ncbi:MAG: DUF2283 domain-containing protein [Verrucomicrobia bacterium]|nr:DUF2283 domain-containing protein [Verrucomicrobiota bacterium]
MSVFASDTPTYSYDPHGDTLYIEYSKDPSERTIEVLGGWPMLLLDLNADDKITGIEFVGAKQFGLKHFAKLLHAERYRLASGLKNPDAVVNAVDQVGDDLLALSH